MRSTYKNAERITQVSHINNTVLLVEDYEANILVTTTMLEFLGYSTDIARSGEEAMQMIKIKNKPYLAILMDVQMLDFDGFETTQLIRTLEIEKKYRHYIIAVTAHTLDGDRDRCLNSGMDDYMSKPINFELLGQKLADLKLSDDKNPHKSKKVSPN